MKAETKGKLEILLKNRCVLIFVCIFLSVVIIFGATLGIIMGVINSKAVVRYESTRLFYDEVVYLASVFKSDYIASLVKSGVTEALIKTVGDALEARELIKLRVLENSGMTVREAAEELAEATRAEVVAVIGTKCILYRESETKKKKIELC